MYPHNYKRNIKDFQLKIELCHEKTGFLSMQKQRRRSASRKCEADHRLCFHNWIVIFFLLPKSQISSFDHLLRLQAGCVGPGRNRNC